MPKAVLDDGRMWHTDVAQIVPVKTELHSRYLDLSYDLVLSERPTGGVTTRNLKTITVMRFDEEDGWSYMVWRDNYPNPFSPKNYVGFTLKQPSHVLVVLYNVLGEPVDTLVNEYREKGTYEEKLVPGKYPAGIYFYKFTAGEFTDTKKAILVK